jgi:hypothetical protein
MGVFDDDFARLVEPIPLVHETVAAPQVAVIRNEAPRRLRPRAAVEHRPDVEEQRRRHGHEILARDIARSVCA